MDLESIMNFFRGNFSQGEQNYDYGANSALNQGYGSPSGIDLLSQPQAVSALGGSGQGMDWLGKGGIVDFGLQGLQALTGIVNANKANKLAGKQFEFQKEMANANLNNSISSFNTRLADRARSRGHVEGQSQAQVDQYINDNKLRR